MRLLRPLAAILAALLPATALLAAPIKVGSVTNVRFGSNWTLDGPQMANTRAKLLKLENFGPSGAVRRAIEIGDTAATPGSIDATLLSQFDVFFVGWFSDSSGNAFTAAELDALRAWVWRGGSAIVTCDSTSVDATCTAFGHPAGESNVPPASAAAAAVDHPLVKGPFGAVAQLGFSGNYSTFTTTAGAVVVMHDASPEQRAAVLVRRWGAGQVVLVTDVDVLANAASAGSGINTDNDRFLGNLFAFAARPYDVMIDAAAHTGGLSGTEWRSDVDILNLGAADATVAIAMLKVSQSNLNPATTPVVVPAGRTLRLYDILAGLFTQNNAALGLTLKGDGLFANSRFYNVGSADGTVYGMYVPSTDDRETVWYGRPGVFHHLSYQPGSTVGTRVNIGGASRVPFSSTVVISLYGDAGELLGTKSHTFQAYEHRQFTKIHETLATPAVTHGFATVEVTTPGGAVDMYAMLIENKSGDPVFMPPTFVSADDEDAVVAQTVATPGRAAGGGVKALATGPGCSGPYQRVVAAAANTTGVNATKWQSDLDLLNFSAGPATVDIALLKANQANPDPLVATIEVPLGQTVRITNVLGTLLPAGNAGLGVRFCQGEALVNARFYNTGSANGNVYGMYVPSMAPDDAVTPCRPGVFHHLSYSPSAASGQRINVGATNATDVRTTWVIRLYGDNGSLLATHTATLEAFEHRQYTNIHKMLGTPAVTSGWATVEVTTPGAVIHPYAMRIENVGGDPIYMPATLERIASSPELAAAFSGAWTGGWANTTFGSSGAAALDLDFDLPNQAVEAELDLDGSVFGGADPPAQSLTGTITRKGIIFVGTSPALGTYSISVDPFCSVAGRLSSLPDPNIDFVDIAGTATPTEVALAYTVYFTPAGGGGAASGTLTLAK